jgi:hypothetical protein
MSLSRGRNRDKSARTVDLAVALYKIPAVRHPVQAETNLSLTYCRALEAAGW